ncbi:unnamed protein product [Rotaria socialis]|uniref:Uncharacterized protein n=1 Tax=Rotaria socialis TaxID=392032 RepID=A0A818DJ71_9BILA|nr:unnamed protein product [Rotaria socialis]CAF4891640.1 unnamed protein product [Rotaria socialis]
MVQLISQSARVTASNFCPTIYEGCKSIEEQKAAVVNPNTPNGGYWNSGGYAPQYIQLEFNALSTVHCASFLVAQLPNGFTHHVITAGEDLNQLKIVTELAKTTTGGELIQVLFYPPLRNVRFLRIATSQSPSWVAWAKIFIYGRSNAH